jgi:hypothetical protein
MAILVEARYERRQAADTGKRGRIDMPPASEIDATSPKYLRDKYAIVGVGETTYKRGSDKTTRALATWAVRNAIEDAGL